MLTIPSYKTPAVGIDQPIQELQKYLLAQLQSIWSVSDYKCFGRAYPNEINGKMRPEIYNGTDYTEVLPHDSVSAISFFLPNGKAKDRLNGVIMEDDVDIYFFVNLEKCYTGSTQRKDEECHCDVIGTIKNGPSKKITVTGIETGNKALSQFEWREKWMDMQPFHIFKINTTIQYYLNRTCN